MKKEILNMIDAWLIKSIKSGDQTVINALSKEQLVELIQNAGE